MLKVKKHKSRKLRDILLGIFIGACIGLIGIWFYIDQKERLEKAVEYELFLNGKYISSRFQSQVERCLMTLGNLGSRIEVTNGDYFDYWTHDARLIINQNASYKFIEWIDSNWIIMKVEPQIGNQEALGKDLSKVNYRSKGLLMSKEDSLVNFTSWTQLQQGGFAFLADVPVYYNETYQGSITAGMDFSKRFDEIMKGTSHYYVEIYDNNDHLFYTYGTIDSAYLLKNSILYETDIPILREGSIKWKFKMIPANYFLENKGFAENRLRLFLILALAVTMGITVYYTRMSTRFAKRTKSINQTLKSLNYRYEKEKERAIEASNVKTEFLSNMSHEIRTPLNAILGLIDIMQQQEVNSEQKKYLKLMEFSSRNLLALINNILEIDKIESGKMELAGDNFCPSEEINKLIDLYRPNFKSNGLYLKSTINAENKRWVKGDKVKLLQVITNLLRNAYKFTAEGGAELVYKEQVSGSGLKMNIKVIDSGIGVPAEKQEEIFERFAQVDSGYQKKYEGSGLGLAISKLIINMMGGKISLISLGQGSEFIVDLVLPLSEEDDSMMALDLEDIKEFPDNYVLIAEDNPMNIMVLSKVLEQMKLKSDVAVNGQEVLDKCKEKQYDLIFMDIHMPVMDGLEATANLRKSGNNTPVVALSANILKETINKALELGIEDYITKPFRREELLRVLRKYMIKRK